MSLITSCLLSFSALLLGGMGALAAGHAGGLAFGLEGMMVAGGLAGLLCSHLSAAVSLLIAGAAGAAYALLLGLAVRKKGDSYFAGVAVNALAAALAMAVAKLIGGVSYSRKTYQLLMNDENITVFLPVALGLFLVLWLALFHTRWGLRLRLCGENGEAARKRGVRLEGMRCLGWLICGFMAGIGGQAAFIALGSGWRWEWGVGGMGMLALAAVALGRWRAWGVLLSAALLSLARVGEDAAAAAGWHVPDGLLQMVPFLLALIVLAAVGARDKAPGEIGRQMKRIRFPEEE